MVSTKYGNFSAYSRAFAPANLPSVPGSGNSLYPRVDAVKTRAVRDAYAFRARLPKGYSVPHANWNRPVRPIPRDLWKGYDWSRPVAAGLRDEFGTLWGAGVSRALSAPNLFASEVQAALAQSVWDMYLNPEIQPVGVLPNWRLKAGVPQWYCGATDVQIATADPGPVRARLTTTLGAYYWVQPGVTSNVWSQVYGYTADEIKFRTSDKICQWHFNLPPRTKGFVQPSPYVFALPSPATAAPAVVSHSVDSPNLDLTSRWSGMDIYGGKPVAVAEPPPKYEPRQEKGKFRSPIYRIFKALEEAGDIGTLLAAFYRAARRQLLEETGRKTVSWEKATWRQRLYVIEWGLIHGVDYAGLAADVGMWWVGERIGAVLGPTVVAPGDRVSSNIRHHNIQSSFSDLL